MTKPTTLLLLAIYLHLKSSHSTHVFSMVMCWRVSWLVVPRWFGVNLQETGLCAGLQYVPEVMVYSFIQI